MKTKPTDEPLRQLLEHGAQDGIDRAFVNQLLDDCRDHAAEYPRKIAHLATATDAEFDASWRSPYLNEFLRYAARDISAVLFFKWTDRAACDAERRRAALLFLHGGGLGYWKISPSNLKAARAVAGIAAKTKGNPTMVRSAKKPKTDPDETKRHLAIMRACMEMEAVCKDDAVEPAAKVDAVETWFQEIEWRAPKELEASMAKAFGLRTIT